MLCAHVNVHEKINISATEYTCRDPKVAMHPAINMYVIYQIRKVPIWLASYFECEEGDSLTLKSRWKEGEGWILAGY